ncbi:TetR/AcrR family transcriptional regulator [Actinophytocola oryzae]|uniref:TetR family transcriptional regulator n=1 Tax=Actinophytocola oryzae TaxID=502181 RepID=A0A4R7VR57_9PSEU|nr:TetR/AcrR family transcriptional regulator [Actinophytocola oryzae]TDV52260.1 TetR family transcriptional regulator [Actinophytocola oryzae]
MTDRRTVIADAAISTIAREGMRGFTHRAVDRTAGLAEGSTSYYFRTREALMFAALARMAELDTVDIGDVPDLGGAVDTDTLGDLLAAVVWRWLTDGRERALARYELTLESTRRPALRARLMSHSATFRLMTEETIAAAGATEPKRRARTMVAHLDGLLLHQLTQVGVGELSEAELRAACRDLLVMALA